MGKHARTSFLLANQHPLSVSLASQCALITAALPGGVITCRLIDKGLVEVLLAAGKEDGYGATRWPLIVGGEGVGDSPEIVERLGGVRKSPVAVRFGVPISMWGVDDIGFVDETFWKGLGDVPTLRAIAERAVEWLRAPADEGQRDQWEEAQAHTYRKVMTCRQFRELATDPSLVDEPLNPAWFPPRLGAAIFGADGPVSPAALASAAAVRELRPGIFSFELFTEAFCRSFSCEMTHFEASPLPKRRPNTMNNGGLVVNEVGMEPLMTSILRRVVSPLATSLFPDEIIASTCDHHHSFVVAYDCGGGDKGLDMHHDASEVTLNVCMGGGFTGGGLRFCGQFGSSTHRQQQCVAEHSVGVAILHLGRQRHGADELHSGERLNLIMWARSSAFRAAAAYGHIEPDGYPKEVEDGPPDRLCLSKANDADFEAQCRRFAGSPGDGDADDVGGDAKQAPLLPLVGGTSACRFHRR